MLLSRRFLKCCYYAAVVTGDFYTSPCKWKLMTIFLISCWFLFLITSGFLLYFSVFLYIQFYIWNPPLLPRGLKGCWKTLIRQICFGLYSFSYIRWRDSWNLTLVLVAGLYYKPVQIWDFKRHMILQEVCQEWCRENITLWLICWQNKMFCSLYFLFTECY